MRKALICLSSLALLCGPALADETVVTHHDAAPGAMIEHRSADTDTVHKKVITHDEDGCATKTVKKTNGEGDTRVHSKTNC